MRSNNPLRTLAVCLLLAIPVSAQDDATTRNGSRAFGGASITGPAIAPVSFLSGNAFGSPVVNKATYTIPDFDPVSLLNRELPAWITFASEERLRFEGYHNSGFKLGNSDSFLLNRVRLQVTIRPTSWFRLVAQTQDARSFLQNPPLAPPNEVRWDLKLAYAEFGDAEKSWGSLRAGRQLLNFNNTMVANADWKNQGRSYDAVVANLHHDRYRLGIFAASVVNPLVDGISHHAEGNNLYGLYGGIDKLLPYSSLEPFVLWRVQPSVAIESGGKVKTGKQDEKAYGFRFKGLALKSLDYSYEAVLERGSDGPNPIRAWAQTLGAGYRFEYVSLHPRIFAQYDYASGDANSADGVHGAFDQMYPSHDRLGIADLFGWQNIKARRGGFTLEPFRRWTVTAQFTDFSLANATDSLYNNSGSSIARDTTGHSGAHVGEEFDTYTWFELNRHVSIGAGVGHLLPGAFLATLTKGPVYNYPYFAVNFKDDGKNQRH